MLRLEWIVSTGWADCLIADRDAEVSIEASYISEAPEELLIAVARVLTSESEAQVEFAGEPAGYRWILHREGDDISRWPQVNLSGQPTAGAPEGMVDRLAITGPFLRAPTAC